MEQLTFRDFAGAIMSGDGARAADVLGALLGLDKDAATAATTHFQTSMAADPSFMTKAMGLRAAVTSGTDAEMGALLVDCFGLAGGAATSAVEELRKRYPR